MFKRLKILILIATTCFSLPSYSDWLSNQMYTLSPTVKVDGPVQDLDQKRKYQSEIFNLILEEAEKLAREYSEVGDDKAYQAFILGALAVPSAEGQNIHFRKENNESLACGERSNSGELLEKNKNASRGFLEIFKKENNADIPGCHELINEEHVLRLIHGWDGSDIGIMQVNLAVAGHRRLYFSQGSWKSVRESIRYGLNIFKKGFNHAYRNPTSCMLNQKGEIIYLNLIRGGWAGWYNSGNHQSNCRFADPNSPWAGNDRHMSSVLERLLSMDKVENINQHYAMEENDVKKMQNIITTFKNLTRNDGPPQKKIKEKVIEFEAFSNDHVQEVTASNLFFRSGPGTDYKECGVLPRGTRIMTTGKKGVWVALHEEERTLHENNPHFDCTEHEGKVYTHSGHLIDQGPLTSTNTIPHENSNEEAVVVSAMPEGTDKSALEENKKIKALALNWLNIREDRPHGYDMAPKTGQILGPNEKVIIVQEIWNSSNSKHPWYKIISPHQGWVYGKEIKKTSE